MLLDSNLLTLKNRADKGDPDALLELADAYYQGVGVPLDYIQARNYLIRIVDLFHPDDLPQFGYGTLLHTIAELHYHTGDMVTANEWYQKSLDYFRETYEDEFGNKFIKGFKLEESIKSTSKYDQFQM